MRMLFTLGLAAGMATWIYVLQRRLRAAQMRGDMYRDVAARLDRRVAELTGQRT